VSREISASRAVVFAVIADPHPGESAQLPRLYRRYRGA
jgi:hypothetical protein